MKPAFASNKALESLVEGIEITREDLSPAVKRFLEEDRLIDHNNLGTVSGMISEDMVRSKVEEIAGSRPEVTLNPIPNGYITRNYLFTHEGKELNVRIRDDSKKHRNMRLRVLPDIDVMTEVDGLLVPWEVKIKKKFQAGAKKVGGLRYAVSPAHVRHKLYPLREIAREMGYVLVMPPEFISFDRETVQNLIHHRGHVIPFYTSSEQFQKDLRQEFEDRGIYFP